MKDVIDNTPTEILVFRTNVRGPDQVGELKPMLDGLIDQGGSWSFDLEDCDSVFRVERPSLPPRAICHNMHRSGFACEELV